MKIMPAVEQEIRRAIRDERAKDPIIPITKLQENLERRFGREFKRTYLTKLSDKVARQTLIEADRTQIEQRMNFTRENYRMMRDRMLKIIYWTPPEVIDDIRNLRPPLNKDVIEAAKNLVMMDLALLQAEIANGLYKKPIDAIAKEIRYDPVPDDVRLVMIASWKRGGLLPAAVIEHMVPLQEHATDGLTA
jgi:hypothetical protein